MKDCSIAHVACPSSWLNLATHEVSKGFTAHFSQIFVQDKQAKTREGPRPFCAKPLTAPLPAKSDANVPLSLFSEFGRPNASFYIPPSSYLLLYLLKVKSCNTV